MYVSEMRIDESDPQREWERESESERARETVSINYDIISLKARPPSAFASASVSGL